MNSSDAARKDKPWRRWELVNAGNVAENEIWANLMGEAPVDVIARSSECPREMTYADFMAMDAFLYTSMNTLFRNYQLAEEGIFTEEEWRESVETYGSWYLGNPFGRVWWFEEARDFFPADFATYVDDQIAGGDDSYAYWRKVRARLVGDDRDVPLSSSCPQS